MKKRYLFLFICFNYFAYSQRVTVSSNVTWPLGIQIKDNVLYVAEADLNRISKINLLAAYPISPVSYVPNIQRSDFMKIKDNTLFYIEYTGNKISKVDLTQSNPTPQNVVSGLSNPRNIVIIDNFLYYSETGKISKIDITVPNAIPQLVLSGLTTPYGIVDYGNYLYYAEYALNKISKIDLTQTTPTPIVVKSGLAGPASELAIKGNLMYFGEYASSSISTLDLSQNPPIYSTFDTNIKVAGFAFNNNDLYVSDFINNKIYKYDLTLSVNESVKKQITFYPNPAKDFIRFTPEVMVESTSIFDINGKLIKEMKTTGNQIDINDLPSGLYLLKMNTSEGVTIKKIIKE